MPLYGILGSILIFGGIIFVHELGHFIVAKLSRMRVFEFAMGFGPRLLSFEKNGTVYALRAVPLGGFVRIAGMEPGEEQTEDGFNAKPFFAKFATILAGAFMNFVLALLVMVIAGMTIGFPKGVDTSVTVVSGVMTGSPAERAGIKPGDQLVAIAGVRHPTTEQTQQLIRTSTPPIPIVIARQGVEMTFMVTPEVLPTVGEQKGVIINMSTFRGIGISYGHRAIYERAGPLESMAIGSFFIYKTIYFSVAGLVSMITGHVPASQMSGTVGILRETYNASSAAVNSVEGLDWFFRLFTLISASVGFMNLLPLPALDGSRLVVLIIEAIRRKPMNREKEAIVHFIGFAVLLGLIAVISVKDVWQWIDSSRKRQHELQQQRVPPAATSNAPARDR